jgi:hypothetical protein
MKPSQEPSSDFQKFDGVVKKLLTVSHKELQKREKKYQRKRAKLKEKKAD